MVKGRSRPAAAYAKAFPQYTDELERQLGGVKTILDVGCGKNSPLARVSRRLEATGVDIYEPDLKTSKRLGIHKKYKVGDIRKLERMFKPKSFDAVLLSDVIEHLTKKEGEKIIKDMERIARKKVIIFTPNGFKRQEPIDGNEHQRHISGWSAAEMERKGYHVIGIGGWDPLRGERAELRLWPKAFWQPFSDMTQLFTRNHPQHAHQILCVKAIRK